jgi:hypothetical protein
MSNNVFQLPFDDLAEIDAQTDCQKKKQAVESFMQEINGWCEGQGVDITTKEYRHQAAVIMTQLQVILMGMNK